MTYIPMKRWRPIEEAPRNGKIIVGEPARDDGYTIDAIAFAFWHDDKWVVLGGDRRSRWQPTHWLDITIPAFPRPKLPPAPRKPKGLSPQYRAVLETARKRRAKALRLYEKGLRYVDIGKELGGCSGQRARQLVDKAREERAHGQA